MAMQGAFYFHPTDEDLSAGTPLGKKALSFCALLYTNWRIAINRPESNVGEGECLSRQGAGLLRAV
jgi:hypothetical protein